MTAYTLATLKAAMQAHHEDQGTYLAASLDDLIGKGEDQLARDLNLEIFKAVAAITFTQGIQTVTKPAGYLAYDTFSYTVAGVTTFLEERSYGYMVDYWPNATTQGLPKYFCDLNQTADGLGQIMVVGTPNAAVAGATGSMRFTKRPTSLVTDTTGTWMSTNTPDLLFHACMAEQEKFAMADDRIDVWGKAYAGKLAMALAGELKNLAARKYALAQ